MITVKRCCAAASINFEQYEKFTVCGNDEASCFCIGRGHYASLQLRSSLLTSSTRRGRTSLCCGLGADGRRTAEPGRPRDGVRVVCLTTLTRTSLCVLSNILLFWLRLALLGRKLSSSATLNARRQLHMLVNCSIFRIARLLPVIPGQVVVRWGGIACKHALTLPSPGSHA